MRDKKPELLVPAGGLDTLKVAVDYGADAVYIGGQAFGLRAKADNFSIEEMKQGVEYAHAHNAKVYVTANIFAHNYDLDGIRAYFGELKDTGVDAVLVSDPGVFTIARETMPDMELHISTQVLVWPRHKAGCVCQRTVPCGDITDKSKHTGRYGDRVIYPWRYVHIIFRKMPSQQLLHRQGCESWCVHPSVQMEVFHRRGDQTGRVYDCQRGRQRNIYI